MGDDLMQCKLGEIFSPELCDLTIYSDCACGDIQNGLDSDKYLKSDIIVIGGGGLVNPDFWAFRDGRIEKMIASQKRVIFLNVNIYEQEVKNAVFCKQLKFLDAIWFVRDSKSKSLLKSIGVDSFLLPDIALSIPPQDIREDSRRMLIYPNYYAFAKHFTEDGNFKDTLEFMNYTSNLADFIDWMDTFGWRTSIVPAQTSRFVDDRIMGAAIYACIKNKESVNWITSPLSYVEHEKLIGESKLVISMRYHSSILAIKHGVACLDIVHHDKNRGLWEDIGLSRNVVDMPFDSGRLISAAEYLAHERTEYKSKTTSYVKEALHQWDGGNIALTTIKNILNNEV